MPSARVSRDQLVSRAHTQVMKEAIALAGKGAVLSKAEQEKMKDWTVLRDAANDIRRTGDKGTQVRLEPWVDNAMGRVTGALDGVDKPGKGHGFISLAEARDAVARKQDAGARIGRAFEVLTGVSLEPKGEASAALKAAVEQHIASTKFEVLASLKDNSPTPWIEKKIEDTLDSWKGDGLMSMGKVKLGGETVHVATATMWDRNTLTEMIGFFDKEGRVLGRAQIERNEDTFALTMRSVKADGSAGDVLATASTPSATPPDAQWLAAFKTEMQKKYDDNEDLGVDMRTSALPAALQPINGFMERNTPDGTGLEKIEFQGKTAYAIHDYSCVSSVQIYAESGEQLMSFVS